MNNRMSNDVAKFGELVESAEQAATQNEGVRVLSGILRSLSKGIEGLTGEQAASVLSATPEGFPEAWQGFNMARDQVAQYIGKVAGEDRSEGDALSRRLTAAVEGDWIEDEEDLTLITDLLTRWTATTPEIKKGRGRASTGASNTPSLGYTVRIKCESHGWTGQDSTGINSARWAALKHCEKEHGGKPAKGNPIWQGLTDALKGVVEGGMTNAQGGGFLVDKLAS